MGGKIFKGLGTPLRLPTDRFEPIARTVAEATGGTLVRWLRDKPDHGDVDVVVADHHARVLGDAQVAAIVGEAVGVEHVHRRADSRDPILFVGLKLPDGIFQADLIGVPAELVDFAASYLSWGDLGLMIGRLARQMGLKFGMNGLRLPVHETSVKYRTVLLTADFDEALRFVGLDPAGHRAGFDDIRASVDWLAAGRFFDPAVFDPARATSDARRRSRARTSQPGMIEDIMSRPVRFPWPDVDGPSELQEIRVRTAVDHFGVAEEVERTRAEMRASAVRLPSAFTLEAVSSATGIVELRDVRALVSIMGEEFPASNAFPEWKAAATPEDVAERARRAVPVLIERRMEEARREVRAEYQRQAAERKRRRDD